MKKGYQMIVKAIEVTKQYTIDEVELLSWLFSYLNEIDIDDEWFGTGVSAKWLWELLQPLTRTWKPQPFREWWESVSNLSRLQEGKDFEKRESVVLKNIENKPSFAWREKSQQAKKWWNIWVIPVKEVDYIVTLRAWEYCAVLTKWESGDLYRRFIFDIKDEFLRLVFRKWRSIETRNEFTKSIGELNFMKKLKESDKKAYGNIYGEMTNLIYLELFWVNAIEYKEQHNIWKKHFAKDFFTKDWLFDLEKLENKLAVIIEYLVPKDKQTLWELIRDFLNKEVKSWEGVA